MTAHVSNVPLDYKFVKTVMRESGLDPRPLANYATMPGAYDETDKWRRVVERYQWGGILFLSNKAENLHATIVAVGDIDLRAGTIGGEKMPVAWYDKMASHFRPLEKTGRTIPVPPCLGHHEDHPTCDGGYNDKGQMEQPCAWRERCILIQGAASAAQKLPDELLKGMSAERIINMTDELKKTQAAVPPSSTAKAPAVPAAESAAPETPAEVATEAEAAPEASVPKQPKERKPRDLELAKRLYTELYTKFTERATAEGRNVVASTKEAEAGDFVVSDRFEASQYISLYCKPESGRLLSLCAVRFRNTGLVAQLPVQTLEDPLLASLPVANDGEQEGLVKTLWKDGQFRTAVKGITSPETVEQFFGILSAMLDSASLPSKAAPAAPAPSAE